MMSEYEQVWIQDLGSNIFGKKGGGGGRGIISFSYFNFIILLKCNNFERVSGLHNRIEWNNTFSSII